MSAEPPDRYAGRFAPSPTGPLHFGSLLAAVSSYLESRRHAGYWFLRIEDIDPPREQAGAADDILRTLDAYGFEWDGEVVYQSRSDPAHRSALATLVDSGLAYPCSCSRRDLSAVPQGPLGPIYPGTCRNGCKPGDTAIRVRTQDAPIAIEDRLQGRIEQRLESESGDFIVLRRDGLIAYHLAVVVDDELRGITDVVRGVDLLDSTPRHVHLQRLLGYRTPEYAHIPVVEHADGSKLSKATGAAPIAVNAAAATLHRALAALQQQPPRSLARASADDVWSWAFENWRHEPLARRRNIALRNYC